VVLSWKHDRLSPIGMEMEMCLPVEIIAGMRAEARGLSEPQVFRGLKSTAERARFLHAGRKIRPATESNLSRRSGGDHDAGQFRSFAAEGTRISLYITGGGYYEQRYHRSLRRPQFVHFRPHLKNGSSDCPRP
jgi:hypothetical protein